MFSWFKKMFGPEMAPEGPATFDFEEEIAATPEHIYALIDCASESNAKRELGHSLVRVGTDPEQYRYTMQQMPDAHFLMTVTEAVPGKVYAYDCSTEVQMGRLRWSKERYTIEQQDNGKCLVIQLVEAQFDAPMPLEEYSQHVAMMAMGCHNALEKLRLHAEEGAQAVLDFEAEQFAD